jgi:hypothetical protein
MTPVGYKIKDLTTGEYYRGSGRWGKVGKMYGRRSDLTAAIRLYSNLFKRYGRDCVIIEYTATNEVPFVDMYDNNLKPR